MCSSTTSTITPAWLMFSSARIVSILIRGLLFRFRSCKLDWYSSAIFFVTSSILLGFGFPSFLEFVLTSSIYFSLENQRFLIFIDFFTIFLQIFTKKKTVPRRPLCIMAKRSTRWLSRNFQIHFLTWNHLFSGIFSLFLGCYWFFLIFPIFYSTKFVDFPRKNYFYVLAFWVKKWNIFHQSMA